jgi:hypothetical protein
MSTRLTQDDRLDVIHQLGVAWAALGTALDRLEVAADHDEALTAIRQRVEREHKIVETIRDLHIAQARYAAEALKDVDRKLDQVPR